MSHSFNNIEKLNKYKLKLANSKNDFAKQKLYNAKIQEYVVKLSKDGVNVSNISASQYGGVLTKEQLATQAAALKEQLASRGSSGVSALGAKIQQITKNAKEAKTRHDDLAREFIKHKHGVEASNGDLSQQLINLRDELNEAKASGLLSTEDLAVCTAGLEKLQLEIAALHETNIALTAEYEDYKSVAESLMNDLTQQIQQILSGDAADLDAQNNAAASLNPDEYKVTDFEILEKVMASHTILAEIANGNDTRRANLKQIIADLGGKDIGKRLIVSDGEYNNTWTAKLDEVLGEIV